MLWNKPKPVKIGKGKSQKIWDPTKKVSNAKREPREPKELMDEKAFNETTQYDTGRNLD